jgi:hypothetical protein
MFRLLLLTCLLLPPSPTADGWLDNPRWDEGLAEVSLYDGQLNVYGIPRDSTLELITVREHFDPERLVKTQPTPGKDVLPVLKLNTTRRTRTGVYEYVQMASAFVHRETGSLVKLSTVHSEWCGNSSVLYRDGAGEPTLFINSYMDDTGVDEPALPDSPPVFYDELLLDLRARLDDLAVGQTFDVVPSFLTSRPTWKLLPAEIVELAPTLVKTEAGAFDARRVVLDIGGRRETFAFRDDDLRVLLFWKDDQGNHYRLRKTMFLDYWNRSRPGDEALLR